MIVVFAALCLGALTCVVGIVVSRDADLCERVGHVVFLILYLVGMVGSGLALLAGGN